MTTLESYQLGGTFFAIQFYADVESHTKDAAVALALEELAFFSVHLRVLSTYRASLPGRGGRTAREPPTAAAPGLVTSGSRTESHERPAAVDPHRDVQRLHVSRKRWTSPR